MVDDGVFDLGMPVLGICYGMQWMMHRLGGGVEAGQASTARPARESSGTDSAAVPPGWTANSRSGPATAIGC